MASSSSKKVSNSTLGLRFMQNALRAKQQEQVDIEQAKVKSDAEWEIDPKVREGWGRHGGQASQRSVTCEASYLPFLFPSINGNGQMVQEEPESSTSFARPTNGRRKFNKNGEEVPLEEPPKQVQEPVESAPEDSESVKRPHSVSGFGGSRHHHGKPDVKPRTDSPSKVSVLKMLSAETSQTVGLDLRASRTSTSAMPPLDERKADVSAKSHSPRKDCLESSRAPIGSSPTPTAKPSHPSFMRPAGVDSPAGKSKPSAEKRGRTVEDEDANPNPNSPGESARRKKKKKKNGGNNADILKSPGD